MAKDRSYKVMLESDVCGIKRATAFHSEEVLSFNEAEEIALRDMSSQTCPRCFKNHTSNDFSALTVKRDEFSVWPEYGDDQESWELDAR